MNVHEGFYLAVEDDSPGHTDRQPDAIVTSHSVHTKLGRSLLIRLEIPNAKEQRIEMRKCK